MINVSNEYKNIIQDSREFKTKVKVTLVNGTILNFDNDSIMSGGLKINDATSGESSLSIGSAIINSTTIKLNNFNGQLDYYDFINATVVVEVGLQLSTRVEYLKKGTYTVDDANSIGGIVILDCLDNMYKFDTPFSGVNISFPCTASQLLRAVCLYCQVSLQTVSFINSNHVIDRKPNDEATTCREIISYIAQLSGNFARININGSLELKWYDMSAFEQSDNLEGGVFDNDTPYSTGDHVDGGDFTFSETEHYDGGTFKQMDKYHHIYALNQSTVGTDDVVITGIQVENTSSESEYSVLFGSQGYVLSISNNPLIQSKTDATTIANTIGAKIVGMRFRTFSADTISDPSIEAGDPCYISVRTSRGYYTHQSFVTSLSYTVSEKQNIKCGAETPSSKQSVRFDASTKTIVEARKQVEQEITTYDLRVKEMTDLITNGFGLFKTEVIDDNGGIIYYMHDQPTIEESEYRWYMTTGGIISQKKVNGEWQTTSGVDKNGNALYNIISTLNLEVGNEIQMAPNATINWGNIDVPSDLAYTSDIPTLPNYITSTKITQTTIESPNITGGIVSGNTIVSNNNVGLSGVGSLDSSVRIWAGSSDKDSAPFRVTQDGSVYMTKANIETESINNQYVTMYGSRIDGGRQVYGTSYTIGTANYSGGSRSGVVQLFGYTSETSTTITRQLDVGNNSILATGSNLVLGGSGNESRPIVVTRTALTSDLNRVVPSDVALYVNGGLRVVGAMDITGSMDIAGDIRVAGWVKTNSGKNYVYLYDSGTNWKQYSDGTMVVEVSKSAYGSINTVWGSLYYLSMGAISFPKTFVGTPSVTFTNTSGRGFMFGYTGATSSTVNTVELYRPVADTQSYTYSFTVRAVGRWQ